MMLRRAFLQRMAWAAAGIGMLGTELLARKPWLEEEQRMTATFKIADGDVMVKGYVLYSEPDGQLLYWDTVERPLSGILS